MLCTCSLYMSMFANNALLGGGVRVRVSNIRDKIFMVKAT